MIRLLKILWELIVRITLGGLVLIVLGFVLVGLFAAGVQSGYGNGYLQGYGDNEERRTQAHEEFCA